MVYFQLQIVSNQAQIADAIQCKHKPVANQPQNFKNNYYILFQITCLIKKDYK